MTTADPALCLDRLEIENFRAFNRFEAPKLGRVNLITGRNNTGKSSLLEALEILAAGGAFKVVTRQLDLRDELTGDNPPPANVVRAVLQLISGRPERFHRGDGLKLRAPGVELSMQLEMYEPREGGLKAGGSPGPTSVPAILTRWTAGDRSFEAVVILDDMARVQPWIRESPEPQQQIWPCLLVPASGVGKDILARMWDSVVLSDQETDVIRAMRIVTPEIERLTFIGEPDKRRRPIVKLAGISQPVPLGSLGDGANRILALALSLAGAKGGLLLIDELENGIHHSLQEKIWTFLLAAATQLNVQVFATTHSWDCLRAFQQACDRDPNAAGVLIRLERSASGVRATIFEEPELNIAARENIEIR